MVTHSTQKASFAPVVVVIGGPASLVDATRQAAGTAAAARAETAETNNAATVVATHRPFAIVMTEAMYTFDGKEFDALARDVNAELIRVEDSDDLRLEQRVPGNRAQLARFLLPRLERAYRKRSA